MNTCLNATAHLNLVGSLWLYNLWHYPNQNVTQHTILVLQYKPIRRLNSAGLLYRLLGGLSEDYPPKLLIFHMGVDFTPPLISTT